MSSITRPRAAKRGEAAVPRVAPAVPAVQWKRARVERPLERLLRVAEPVDEVGLAVRPWISSSTRRLSAR